MADQLLTAAMEDRKGQRIVKVAEVVQNGAGQVYVDWLGSIVMDYVGQSLYIIKNEGDEQCES